MASIKKEQILESIEFCEKNGYFNKLNDIYSTLPKEIVQDAETAAWNL